MWSDHFQYPDANDEKLNHALQKQNVHSFALPGLMKPPTNEQDTSRVCIQLDHLKLQASPNDQPWISPHLRRHLSGLQDGGIEAAVHQATHECLAYLVDHSLCKS